MHGKDTCDNINYMKIILTDNEELPVDIARSLDDIALKEGYKSGCYEVSHRAITTDGGNYMGLLFETDIRGICNNNEREVNLFIKKAICGENVKILDVVEIFSKEIYFYRELCKLFEQLEIGAAIPSEKRYNFAPSFDAGNMNMVILQNMAKEGFKTVHRMEVMPLKLAELSVQQLARLHSLSFVVQQTDPEYFNSKIKSLKPPFVFGEDFDKYCKDIYKVSMVGLSDETRKKLEERFSECLQRYKQYIMCKDDKVKCICHGDFRMSNILIKSSNGEIDKVIPVDFQLLYYGSPMTDFIYLMYTATDQSFRKDHLENLKELYYETMNNHLSYFKIDVDSVYPRKVFASDFEDCLEYGLFVMLFMMPFVFALETDIPDLNRNELFDIKMNLDKIYYDRLKGTIDDMVEYGKL